MPTPQPRPHSVTRRSFWARQTATRSSGDLRRWTPSFRPPQLLTGTRLFGAACSTIREATIQVVYFQDFRRPNASDHSLGLVKPISRDANGVPHRILSGRKSLPVVRDRGRNWGRDRLDLLDVSR